VAHNIAVPPTWRIDLLGGLEVRRGEEAVTRFRTRRVGLLLAYLALPVGRSHARADLGDALWPDTEPEAARRNLRQALTSLRKVLEPPDVASGSVVMARHDTIRLNPELIEVDVKEFESLVSRARWMDEGDDPTPMLERAIALYRGDLLPGNTEDWILAERFRLDDLYLGALRSLVTASLERHRPQAAIEYLHLALAREPLNEDWHLNLMEQYLHAGRPAHVVRQFEELQTLLQTHLGCAPSPKALDYLRRAKLKVSTPLATVTADQPPIVPKTEREERVVRLPVTFTRLWGREQETARVRALLAEGARLVTILGPAGTGKTRLSVEVGHAVAADGGSDVAFVALADLDSRVAIVEAVLDALRIRRTPDRSPEERMVEGLRECGDALLIFDNFEHVVEAGSEVAHQILDAAPQARLIVTSRESLDLEAERRVELSPLPTPPEMPATAQPSRAELSRLLEYPSVRLFIDRCQSIRPDFGITSSNAAAIVAICAKLEGVPLALELAAALSGSFAPRQVLNHLSSRLTTLSSRRRDLPPRHRSLRAAIDYSYETLSPTVQRFFAALGVFRGGFSLSATTAVAGHVLDDADDDACLRTCLRLKDQSLLLTEPQEEGGELRFRMLESFREFAEEALPPSDSLALRERHARYFGSQGLKRSGLLSREEIALRARELNADSENLSAALRFWLEVGNPREALGVLRVMADAWSHRGPRSVERDLIRRLAQPDLIGRLDPRDRIELLRMLGTAHLRSADYAAAHRACEEALQIARAHDLGPETAYCHAGLATCSGFLGDLESCAAHNAEAMRWADPEDFTLMERIHLGFGAVHWGRAEFEAAEAAYLRAAEYSARWRGGDPDLLILANLGRVAFDTGRLDEGMRRVGEGMTLSARLNDPLGRALCLALIGRYHLLIGDAEGAAPYTREAVQRFRDTDFWLWSMVGVFEHARVLAARGRWEASAKLLAATQWILPSRLPDRRDHEATVETVRHELGSDRFESAWAQGLTLGIDDAFRLALEEL
jgi:predicted ATPase/DNA-binding SARP family transcriptional activator